MINESEVIKTDAKLAKSRWLLWLALSLILTLVLGMGFTDRFVSINDILNIDALPTPTELAEQNIIHGSEKQRYDALVLIKKDRLQVDLEMLKKVFSSENSFRVRKQTIEIIMRRLELPDAKMFLEQILPLESDPKILKIINYKLKRVSENMKWLYKM